MNTKRSLIYRVDGGTRLGMGHIQRAAVLGAELQGDFDIRFYVREDDTGFRYLKNAGFDTLRIPQDMHKEEEANMLSAPVILVDILDTRKSYMAALKGRDSRLVTFENQGPGAAVAEIVINAMVEGPENRDYVFNGTRYLKGARYKILSPDFDNTFPKKKKNGTLEVVVTLGGGDVTGILPKVLRSIAEIKKDIHVTAIAGPAHKEFGGLKRELKGISERIDLFKEVSNMAELLSRADVAITAGGGTLYEIAFLGVPGIVICQCDHQQQNAARFEKKGTVINLGYASKVTSTAVQEALSDLLEDPEKRKEMSEKGKDLIDGQGRERVTGIIKESDA